MNDVELIDISPFTTPTANCSEADRITVAQDVSRALSTKGFVHLTGHGIPQTLIESAFAITGVFFSGTDETKKLACSKDRARRGYSPCHAENFASLLGTMNAPNDSVEKFRCGPMVDEVTKAEDSSYYGSKEGRLHFYDNTWTGTPESFHATLRDYYQAMEQLSLSLLQILELSLTLPQGYLCDHMHKHTSILTVNHYPTLLKAPPLKDDIGHNSSTANHYPTLPKAASPKAPPLKAPSLQDGTGQNSGTVNSTDIGQNTDTTNPSDQTHNSPILQEQELPPSDTPLPQDTLLPQDIPSPQDTPLPQVLTQVRVAEHTDVSMLTIVAASPQDTPSPQVSTQVRVAEHTDVSMLTIVAASAPGLEIYEKGGASGLEIYEKGGASGLEIYKKGGATYQPVAHVQGALVVNIGDCLRDWSGGRLVSTKHRVVLPVEVAEPHPNKPRDTVGTNSVDSGQSTYPGDKDSTNPLDPDGQATTNSAVNNAVSSQRLSLAYFVTPNHNTPLHPFPTPPPPPSPLDPLTPGLYTSNTGTASASPSSSAIAVPVSVLQGTVSASPSPAAVAVAVPQGVVLTYDQWRKQRISSVIKVGR